jgi:putative copper export protein
MQAFFEWMNGLAVSTAIRESVWFYTVDQAFHLVALGIFAGAVLVVDLRLLGRGMREQPIAKIAKDAEPWFIGAFLVLALTGIPQMISNAMREYYSEFFWFKMEVMVVALIFTFTLRRKVAMAEEGRVAPIWLKMVGLASIVLWLGVAIPARLIGLFT